MPTKEYLKSLLKFIKEYESIGSTIMGMLVVIVVGSGLSLYLSRYKQAKQVNEVEISQVPSPPVEFEVIDQLPETRNFYQQDGQYFVEGLPVKYMVKLGDSSWKVAQAFYGSGENYSDIERENNLSTNADLIVGQEIDIPNVPTKMDVQEIVNAADDVKKQIEATSSATAPLFSAVRTHTVKTGEGLWQIAEQYYKDGNRYVKIFEANKDRMKNAEDIRVGMELRIPE